MDRTERTMVDLQLIVQPGSPVRFRVRLPRGGLWVSAQFREDDPDYPLEFHFEGYGEAQDGDTPEVTFVIRPTTEQEGAGWRIQGGESVITLTNRGPSPSIASMAGTTNRQRWLSLQITSSPAAES